MAGESTGGRPGRYERGTEEFSRVLAFSDGLFAIAITLLVLALAVPDLRDPDSTRELLRGLHELRPEFLSFVISFAVIGRYWVAHHQFFARLGAIDGGLLSINLLYLAFVAFLPFPTDLLGNYFDNPVAVSVYAVAVAAVSGLEVVLFARARSAGLLRRTMPADVYRWARLAAFMPVVFFLLSVPVAFVSSGAAVALWFATVPFQILVLNRRKPAGVDELL